MQHQPKGPEWGEVIAGPKSPVIAVLLSTLCCLPLGHLYLGQGKKALFYFVFMLAGSLVAFGGLLVWVFMVIDAYNVAKKMTAHGQVRELENGIDLMDQVFGPKGIIKS